MDFKLDQINIEFNQLKYTVSLGKEKKNVINEIHGEFKSGELTAIMGPSGAGKSSLLNILTGFTKKGVQGIVNMSNEKKGAEQNYRKLCSYILQDDNLYPNFTVQETMMIATNLKIAGISNEEKELIIDNILNTLHLYHTKSTKCGCLSGGQKKRLSIALELLDNPPVMFLDEPTTGLDSSSSAYCVRLLHNLAREGRTIVCTIHQPAATVYEMFDHVYVMAAGQCIYQGSASNTVPYLSSNGLQCPQYHNSADFLLEVATGEYGNFIPQLSKASSNNHWRLSGSYIQDDISPIEPLEIEPLQKEFYRLSSCDSGDVREVPSEWSKFWTLVGRCQINCYRDWTVTHLKLVIHVLCAILISLMYRDSGINATKAISNVSLLVVGIIYLWYTTAMPGVLKFPSEIAILKKETFNNWYKLRTYFLATLLTTTPIHILFSAIYSTIIYFMTEQPMEYERYFKFTLVYILTTIVADGFGLLLGAVVDPINGTFISAVLTAFKLAFCGFLVLINHMPKFMTIFAHLSTHSYSLEALVLSIYDNGRSDTICPEEVMYCHYKSSKLIIQELGMKPKNYDYDVGLIFLQFILFKGLAYFLLKRRLKSDN